MCVVFWCAEFEDLNGGCPNVSELAPRPSYLYPILPQHDRWAWYERVLTFQADGNSTGVGNPPGYCYSQQPAWSAYRGARALRPMSQQRRACARSSQQ